MKIIPIYLLILKVNYNSVKKTNKQQNDQGFCSISYAATKRLSERDNGSYGCRYERG